MTWKLLGLGIYLAALMGLGIVASRRMSSVRDYFAGNKQFGFLAAAFSARATGESAWLLIGLTGMGAAVGAKAFWVVLGEVVGVLAAWALMCGRFKRLTDRYDSITIPDYLESRFQDSTHLLRIVAAFALMIFVTIYVSAQIDATGTAFESFLGIDYFVGALLGFAVVTTYIVSGGFVAVVWSDVFQGTLMFLGLTLLPLYGLWHAGGLEPVIEGLRAIDPALVSFTAGKPWSLKLAFEILAFALIGLGFLGSPQIFVRFLSLKSDKEVLPGCVVAVLFTLFSDSGAVLLGMVGRHLLTGPGMEVTEVLGNKGQDVLPMLSEFLLPAALVGLVIAVVLSAIMSTVDSLLVVASSAVVRDLYQKVMKPETPDSALVPLSRVMTVVLALLALGVAMIVAVTTPDRSVFWFVVFGWSGIAATFCPTMILSLYWSRFTAKGALAAMVTGFTCVPLFKFVLPDHIGVFATLEELPPAFLFSMAAGVIVSLLTRAPPDAAQDLLAARGSDA